MGGEDGRSAASYARTTGDLLLPSRPIAQSPHAAFLRDYQAHGEDVFLPERFEATPYYRNAATCIERSGHYFTAKDPRDIVHRARKFCKMFDGSPLEKPEEHENAPGSPVVVRRIMLSDCYEIIHGQHRLAVAAVKGREKYKCVIQPIHPVLTPLQQMVMDFKLDARPMRALPAGFCSRAGDVVGRAEMRRPARRNGEVAYDKRYWLGLISGHWL